MMGFNLQKYSYYRAPDGMDPAGKIFGVGKSAAFISALIAGADICYNEKNPTFWNCVNRAAFWTMPIFSMGLAFASITFIATDLRKKDDSINYVLGGAAAGAVSNVFTKNKIVTLYAMGAFALAGILIKSNANGKFAVGLLESTPYYVNRYIQTQFDFDWTYQKDNRPWKQ